MDRVIGRRSRGWAADGAGVWLPRFSLVGDDGKCLIRPSARLGRLDKI